MNRHPWMSAALLGLAALAGCGGGADQAPPDRPAQGRASATAAPAVAVAVPGWFEDVTERAGLPLTWSPGYGSSWGDVDGDGHPDVWVGNHMYRPTLLRNLGDGRFVDATDAHWAGDPTIDAHGAAWADADNDGDQDLIELAGTEQGTASLDKPYYLNDGGRLVDQADRYGLNDRDGRGRTPLWLDWNADGRLDLYVVNARRPADDRSPSRLMIQQADGTFVALAAMSAQSDAHTAQLLYVDRAMHLLVANDAVAFPAALHVVGDPQPVPMVVDGLPAASVVRGKVRDTVVADFDGDLHQDVLVLQTRPRDPAAQVSDDGRTLHVIVKSIAQERGFRFRTEAARPVTLRLYATPARADLVRLGASAVESGIRPVTGVLHGESMVWKELHLDPDDLAVQGQAPAAARQARGVYIGRDPDGTWQLLAHGDSGDVLDAELLAGGDDRYTAVEPVGMSFVDDLGRPPVLLAYRTGQRQFIDRAAAAGLLPTLACTSGVAGDFDNDQDQDLYLACTRAAGNLDNRLFENVGGRFVEVPGAGGGATAPVATGGKVSMADIDGDGGLDLLVTDGCEACGVPLAFGRRTLLRNLRARDHHWIAFDLRGCASNRDGLGARVVVHAGGRRQLRVADGGMHHGVQNHARLHVGLGPNTVVERVVVYWPSGKVSGHAALAADRRHTLHENRACPRP